MSVLVLLANEKKGVKVNKLTLEVSGSRDMFYMGATACPHATTGSRSTG